jgi:hypothetical protein
MFTGFCQFIQVAAWIHFAQDPLQVAAKTEEQQHNCYHLLYNEADRVDRRTDLMEERMTSNNGLSGSDPGDGCDSFRTAATAADCIQISIH